MSQESNRTRMALFIGRPVISGQWNFRSFPTRNITRQARLRNAHYQVHTYPVAPFFDAPAARQLLTSADYTVLNPYVSLLELDYQQCITIVDSLTIFLDNLPGQVVINFRLEYETGNPEHQDAFEQAHALVARRPEGTWSFGITPNVNIEGSGASGELPVSGDDGLPAEEDSPLEVDDDDSSSTDDLPSDEDD